MFCLGLTGCINLEPVVDPTRTFLLYAPGLDNDDFRPNEGSGSIYVDRVDIPPYLDDNRLVVRLSNEQIEYDEFVRWAEPLDQGIARSIALNLLALPRVNEISYYPWKRAADAQLSMHLRVFKFEKFVNNQVEFHGVLEIRSIANPSENVFKFPFQVSEEIRGDDERAVIQAMSMAIRNMTQQLAATHREQNP